MALQIFLASRTPLIWFIKCSICGEHIDETLDDKRVFAHLRFSHDFACSMCATEQQDDYAEVAGIMLMPTKEEEEKEGFDLTMCSPK